LEIRSMNAIYLLGMSHIMPILRACSPVNDDHYSHFGNGIPPSLIDWPIVPDSLPAPLKVASIYVGHTAPFWGPVLALHDQSTGLACADGFRRLLESIELENGKNPILVCMNGEEHIHMSRRRYEMPHDFFLAERPDLPIAPNRQVLPASVIEKQAHHLLAAAKANFSAMRAICPQATIINVLCPPPVVGTLLPPSAPERLPSGETNDPLRLKHYLVYARLLREFLTPLGIHTLTPPPETLTPEGMLRAEYTGDPVHGNVEYGHRVLAQLRSVLTK
jgi:hypothetical protein